MFLKGMLIRLASFSFVSSIYYHKNLEFAMLVSIFDSILSNSKFILTLRDFFSYNAIMFTFTSIRLNNFKLFRDITLDLTKTKNSVKPLVVIYGANGSGKTSITEAVAFLLRSIDTMSQSKRLQEIMQNADDSLADFPFKTDFLTKNINCLLQIGSTRQLIQNVIHVEASNMSLEFNFKTETSNGTYVLETNREEIIHEQLIYTLAKRRVVCFDISKEKKQFNPNFFTSEEFKNVIEKDMEMYYGKHSILSMLSFEIDDKSEEFVDSGLNNSIYDFMCHLQEIDIYLHHSVLGNENDVYSYADYLTQNLDQGDMPSSKQEELRHMADILLPVLHGIFPEIQNVYYKTKESKDKKLLHYQMFLTKRISGETYDLQFSRESSGTKKILHILPCILSAMKGHSVIIDEFGSEIHDKMAKEILEHTIPYISGQLILTTHATGLLNGITRNGTCSNISPDVFYFITSSANRKKNIIQISDIENRLYSNYNYQDRYLYHPLFEDALPDTDIRDTLYSLSKQLTYDE